MNIWTGMVVSIVLALQFFILISTTASGAEYASEKTGDR
jgi:hypothetical protein